ncbi:MAG: winged helix-turn-helix transcriptional regulator [Endomicrobiales bacterium]|nr:winged helix-turn-helix transcriptional regulator [Endomicrobiales bacterium]
MLEPLFGNRIVEKVLLYLLVYGDGYIRGIARAFGIPVTGVVQQLRRLEDGGVVVSQLKGKVRLYQFNPAYPFLGELKALLEKAMDVLPQDEIEKYYRMRTRPRRKGKP